MISAEQLAAIVGRKVKLQKRGGRWWGLCPFHHEKTPSFYVWTGRRGEGRYHCQGCGADGDGIDWLRKVEGQRASFKPNPELIRQRQERLGRTLVWHDIRDRYPDLPLEAEDFIEPSQLEKLGARLQRHLQKG